MPPHTIRLRGPWNVQLDEQRQSLAWPDEISPWLKSAAGQSITLERRFHRPTGLAGSTRLWLVCDLGRRDAAVALNDQPLGTLADATRFDITARVAESNLLRITLVGGDVLPLGEVRLEIDEPDGD